MSNPYLIAGPALISFSGGRTSAYMLHEIVRAHGGTLPSDVLVTFANTGREMPQTLDFVRDCGERFGVEIVWLEYQPGEHGKRWKRVDYTSAARQGEPFDALIAGKKFLPNVVARFCTMELKIRPMRDFARSLGWDHWTNVVGLRADERHRVASLREGALRERWEVETPLATAGVTKADISAAWAAKNWRLNLPTVRHQTPLGNCDLCFLKGEATLAGIMRQFPGIADWWVAKEIETGATWSKRFSHADLARRAQQPDLLATLPNEARGDCYCTGDA
jgi:3'-phosphoadenosine 5'-phosphosulfate sulfotransferase (PAPS reductase)/FAD synthetase